MHICGVKIDPYGYEEALSEIDRIVSKKNRTSLHHIVTPNPEIILAAQSHKPLREAINAAYMSLADGFGLLLFSKKLRNRMHGTVTGVDLCQRIFALGARKKWRIFFLGGKPDRAMQAAKNVSRAYPGIVVAGALPGPRHVSYEQTYPNLIQTIVAAKPDILIVSFGCPKQELFIARHAKQLSSVAVAISAGGTIDTFSGAVKRAPEFFRQRHLEWFFRLVHEPQRFFRIMNAVIFFPLLVIRWKIQSSWKYRNNVVGLIRHTDGDVLLVSPRRLHRIQWQFPQGGIEPHETIEEAARREMKEEVNLSDLDLVATIPDFYSYVWPKWARDVKPYKGQKQSLAIFQYFGSKRLDLSHSAEIGRFFWTTPEKVESLVSSVRADSAKKIIAILKNYPL